MNQQKSIKYPYMQYAAAILIALLVSAALWYFPKSYSIGVGYDHFNILSEDGAWDLTFMDFDNQTAFLDGRVEHIKGKLVAPEDFDSYRDEIVYEYIPVETRIATARLRIIVPEDRSYALSFYSNDYSDRIYINGELRGSAGTPGETPEEMVPGWEYFLFEARPVDGVIEILRQGSNFVHKDTANFVGIEIGKIEIIKQKRDVEYVFSSIIMGLFLGLFVVHIVLYLIISDFRPNLWFALFCLFWCIRTGFVDEKPLWGALPDIPWVLVYKLGCISIASSGILILMIVHDEFEGVLNKWVVRIIILGYALYIIYYIFADTLSISNVKIGPEILMGIMGIYIAIRLVLVMPARFKSGEVGFEQVISIAGLLMVFISQVLDSLFYANIHIMNYHIKQVILR